jgi:hypothetical protein
MRSECVDHKYVYDSPVQTLALVEDVARSECACHAVFVASLHTRCNLAAVPVRRRLFAQQSTMSAHSSTCVDPLAWVCWSSATTYVPPPSS